MEEMEIYKILIGNEVKKEDLIDVDCYVHNKIGLFIPSTGPCLYASKDMHTHPSYMFVIRFSEECNHRDHYSAIVSSPDIPHNDIVDGNYYCIMIEREYFENQYKMYEQPIPVFQSKEFVICRDILKALNTFAFECSKQMPNSKITLEAQMTIITHWLIRSLLGETLDMRAISANYSVARAEHYIEKHYAEKITVNRLADLGNVSVSSMNRMFKKETGSTPMEYLMEIRLEKAKILLRRKQLPVTEIALRCGFGSSSHFSSSFVKLQGISPTDYRKAYFAE